MKKSLVIMLLITGAVSAPCENNPVSSRDVIKVIDIFGDVFKSTTNKNTNKNNPRVESRKPIDNKISLTKDQLDKLIDDAYKKGLKEGYKQGLKEGLKEVIKDDANKNNNTKKD